MLRPTEFFGQQLEVEACEDGVILRVRPDVYLVDWVEIHMSHEGAKQLGMNLLGNTVEVRAWH